MFLEEYIEELITTEEEREDDDIYDDVSELEAAWFSFATGDGDADKQDEAKRWLIEHDYIDE